MLSSVSQQFLVAALLKYFDLELEERPDFSVCRLTVYQSNQSENDTPLTVETDVIYHLGTVQHSVGKP